MYGLINLKRLKVGNAGPAILIWSGMFERIFRPKIAFPEFCLWEENACTKGRGQKNIVTFLCLLSCCMQKRLLRALSTIHNSQKPIYVSENICSVHSCCMSRGESRKESESIGYWLACEFYKYFSNLELAHGFLHQNLWFIFPIRKHLTKVLDFWLADSSHQDL